MTYPYTISEVDETPLYSLVRPELITRPAPYPQRLAFLPSRTTITPHTSERNRGAW